jgi:hypothetical protein
MPTFDQFKARHKYVFTREAAELVLIVYSSCALVLIPSCVVMSWIYGISLAIGFWIGAWSAFIAGTVLLALDYMAEVGY